MHDLIQNIQREVISNLWANKKGAHFEYDKEKNHYRLIEMTADLKSYIVGLTQRNETNCPVVAKNFVAYLIRNWGKSEKIIFENYYTKRLNNYKHVEQRKAGSSMRDLDTEFYPFHVSEEKESASFSELIYPYLSSDETELIKQYVKAYFRYIKQTYNPKKTTDRVLSIPDWGIVFYYIDEAGDKKESKINRMTKFIEKNNVVNLSGELTSSANFKKEYYLIKNRINGKNNKIQLPPERIRNILPYLKKHKKAMENAVNDIDYLTSELQENNNNHN